jgi:hypothetical protein
VGVPLTYLVAATEVDFVVFEIHHDATWFEKSKVQIFQFFHRGLSWAYGTGNAQSALCCRRCLEEENRTSSRLELIDIDAVMKRRVSKERCDEVARYYKEDDEFAKICAAADFSEIPEPRRKSEEQGLFTVTPAIVLGYLGKDQYMTKKQAIDCMLAPVVAKDKDPAMLAAVAKRPMLAKKFTEKTHLEVDFSLEFARSKQHIFIGGWITARVAKTGEPIIFHYKKQSGVLGKRYRSYGGLPDWHRDPATFTATFLLDEEKKQQIVYVVTGNEFGIEVTEVVATPKEKAKWTALAEEIYGTYLRWFWEDKDLFSESRAREFLGEEDIANYVLRRRATTR